MNVEDELKRIQVPKELDEFIGAYYKALTKRARMKYVGKSEFCCFRRFINMYESGKYRFAFKAVRRMFEFLSYLIYYDEEGQPQYLNLSPAQRFILTAVFGLRNQDESYVVHVANIYMARRNGKSFLLGALIHYIMNMSKWHDNTVILASCKGETAEICFDEFAKLVDNTPSLAKQYSNVNRTAKWAKAKETHNVLKLFRTGSGAKKTLDGKTNRVCIIDEECLCDPIIPKTLFDGQKHFRDRFAFTMSTAQFDVMGPHHKNWTMLRKQLYENTLPEDRFLFLAEPDEEEIASKDFANIRLIAKSNPVLFYDTKDGFTLKQHIRDSYLQSAREAISKRGFDLQSWATKQCNIWYATEDRSICSYEELEQNGVDFTFKDVIYAGYKKWYLGLDFSKTTDLSSVAWVVYITVDKDGKLVKNGWEDITTEDTSGYTRKCFAHVISWLPKNRLKQHVDTDRFQYYDYLDRELFLCNSAGGESIDPHQIFEFVNRVREEMGIYYVTITADQYGTAGVKEQFADICDWYIEQNQSPRALSQYVESLSKDFKSGNIIYYKYGEDILKQAVMNALLVKNGSGYFSIEKASESGHPFENIRIDPCDALTNGYIACLIDENRRQNSSEDVKAWLKMMKGRNKK